MFWPPSQLAVSGGGAHDLEPRGASLTGRLPPLSFHTGELQNDPRVHHNEGLNSSVLNRL